MNGQLGRVWVEDMVASQVGTCQMVMVYKLCTENAGNAYVSSVWRYGVVDGGCYGCNGFEWNTCGCYGIGEEEGNDGAYLGWALITQNPVVF